MSATLQTPCELPSVTCRQRLRAKRRAAWRGAARRDLDRRRRMGDGSASGVFGRQGAPGPRDHRSEDAEGKVLFGTLDLDWQDTGEYAAAIGLRTANDKSMSIQLAVGMHVFVCSNMTFASDLIALRRRHTARLDVPRELAGRLGRTIDPCGGNTGFAGLFRPVPQNISLPKGGLAVVRWAGGKLGKPANPVDCWQGIQQSAMFSRP
jgi:hypothetical protein